MPRDIPVGNGSVLVAFDSRALLRDLYFPYVGQENHAGGDPFRLGVWVDGRFGWVGEGWQITRQYVEDTLVTHVVLTHDAWKLRIVVNDLVDFHENIYLKKLTVENLSGAARAVRLFLSHDFYILGNDIGDTAAYRPEVKGLLHYKEDRYFLINVWANEKAGIDLFATGRKKAGTDIGTWKDAEDGQLSGNPIAQGSVDSVVGIPLKPEANGAESCYYWMCIGRNWHEVNGLNSLLIKKGPEEILKRTANYWRLWANKEELNAELLPEDVWRLYKRSLLVCRTQINNNGSIIAANDSDVEHFNRDTYSYMWPRDAALAAYALDQAGYFQITRDFFNLCAEIMEPQGYFLHKYNPSGSLASSWLPWRKDNETQLPIQEDETALVIRALWNNYGIYRDIEFIKPLYKAVIKSAGDFMMNYRDTDTGLPLPSWDLWEERRGVLTFTTAAVYAGLQAAANFTEAFGDVELSEAYRRGAERMRDGMDKYLYLEDEKRFCRMVNFKKDGSTEVDKTLDASLYGVFAFGVYPADDDKVKNTMRQVHDRLWCRTSVGGLARYENDRYHHVSDAVPGNPWFVTTLWLAQYYVAAAAQADHLDRAMDILKWVAARALPSGVLAEQVNPETDAPLSVSPLTWSHATYVGVVQEYLNKRTATERCETCGRPRYSKTARERRTGS